jgi:hypothetical protein
MQFLLFCCFNEKKWESLPTPQRDGIMRDYGEWVRSLTASGHHLTGAQLMPTATARSIRGGGGKAAVTDGPFAETKEQLGGYHLMECRDFDEALAMAQRIPTIPHGGTVEVRAVIDRQETA